MAIRRITKRLQGFVKNNNAKLRNAESSFCRFFDLNAKLGTRNDAGLSAGESLGARYCSQTFACTFTFLLSVIAGTSLERR